MIFDAIRDGDVEAVRQYLDGGGKVDARARNGATPLYHLLEYGQENKETIARLLIDAGADAKAKRSKRAYSPLHLAVNQQQAAIVRMLIERGADVNENDNRLMFAPLHLPTTPVITQMLLDAGAQVDVPDAKGLTPLLRSITTPTEEYTEAMLRQRVELLLDAGADIARLYPGDASIVHGAIQRVSVEVATMLIERGADIRVNHRIWGTPLHLAVGYGGVAFVKLLLDHGADVNAKRKSDGWTPIFEAARSESEETVRAMLDAGADASVSDRFRKRPVDYANTEGIKRLLTEAAA